MRGGEFFFVLTAHDLIQCGDVGELLWWRRGVELFILNMNTVEWAC